MVSQKSKEVSWMKKLSSDSGLDIDEDLKEDLGIAGEDSVTALEDKKIEVAVKRARAELRTLLQTPIVESSENPEFRSGGVSVNKKKKKKSNFIVVAK